MMHILWLEDRPEMLRFDIEELRRLTKHTFEMVESPYEVMDRITDVGNIYDKIILDIMIPATPSLIIKDEPYNTSKGLETGLVLYEYFLLERFKKEVIFYTSRKITPSLINKVKGWKNTKLIQKNDLKPGLLNCLK